MKFNQDEGTPIQLFEKEVVALIDSASDELTLCEMVGVLELNLHILKNRMTLPKSP